MCPGRAVAVLALYWSRLGRYLNLHRPPTRRYGEYFVHRTGHNIGAEAHGEGANMDNFETHDIRAVLPNTCFSVEPGIYLPAFGVRSEVNVYVGADELLVTGGPQREMMPLLA